MKVIALTVLLTIAQAAPPVPRKAANPQTSATQNIKDNANNNQGPSDAHPPLKQQTKPAQTQDKGQDPSDADARQTIVIRESTPVPKVGKDWWDKAYVIFTGALVVIGFVGVGCAVVTLWAIRAQVTVMAQQRQVMLGQLRTMQEQIAEMSEQTDVLEKSVAAAQSGIEAGINERRARIKIKVSDVHMSAVNPDAGQLPTHMATVSLFNYGLTTAFVDDFRARFLHTPQEDAAPDYSNCRQFVYAESLAPNSPPATTFGVILEPNAGFLTENEIMSVKRSQSYIHFYGFVRYRDVYERRRRQTIHIRWTMRWGGTIEGQVMAWWLSVGPLEENQDSEEEKPN